MEGIGICDRSGEKLVKDMGMIGGNPLPPSACPHVDI